MMMAVGVFTPVHWNSYSSAQQLGQSGEGLSSRKPHMDVLRCSDMTGVVGMKAEATQMLVCWRGGLEDPCGCRRLLMGNHGGNCLHFLGTVHLRYFHGLGCEWLWDTHGVGLGVSKCVLEFCWFHNCESGLCLGQKLPWNCLSQLRSGSNCLLTASFCELLCGSQAPLLWPLLSQCWSPAWVWHICPRPISI